MLRGVAAVVARTHGDGRTFTWFGKSVILFDFNQMDWQAYNPGLLEQDVFTIPLEAGLIGAMNEFYTPAPHPLIHFPREVRPVQRNSSRHPKALLAPLGAAWAVSTLGYFEMANDRFPISPLVRGWIHTHLATELATTFAKVTFQRPRPFYDMEVAQGLTPRKDDRFSFFSGHASHAFAFAGYSSSLVMKYTDNSIGGMAYTAGALTVAGVVARARAIDGQHNWSDIVVGGLVGATTSVLMFNRVEAVIDDYSLRPAPCQGEDECKRWSMRAMIAPLMMKFEKSDIFGLSLDLQF